MQREGNELKETQTASRQIMDGTVLHVYCDEVRLHVLATNGNADARVYEVRAYEQAD